MTLCAARVSSGLFPRLSLVLPLLFVGTAGPAQDINSRVMVPDAPNGAVVGGCYRADRPLYGPYALSFCLERKGVYQVRGGGTRCTGRLDWQAAGRDVKLHLRKQSCGGGRAWAEANVTCRPRSLLDMILSELLRKKQKQEGRVMIDDLPVVSSLRCTYYPTVRGEERVSFIAKRSD